MSVGPNHKEVFTWGLLSEGFEASVDVLLYSGALKNPYTVSD